MLSVFQIQHFNYNFETAVSTEKNSFTTGNSQDNKFLIFLRISPKVFNIFEKCFEGSCSKTEPSVNTVTLRHSIYANMFLVCKP